MRKVTKIQRKINDTLKLDTLGGREITADELDQVAGGLYAPVGAFMMQQILAAQRELLLGDMCPCSGMPEAAANASQN